MRIVFVSLPQPPLWSGGVPTYSKNLALKLIELGHTVDYIFAAQQAATTISADLDSRINYVPIPIELSYQPLSYPLKQVQNKPLQRSVVRVLEGLQADIVHVHNTMGFPLLLVKDIKALGYPVFVSHHDYWWLCAQVHLIDTSGSLCSGPSNSGLKCAECVMQGLGQGGSFDYFKALHYLAKLPPLKNVIHEGLSANLATGYGIRLAEAVDILNTVDLNLAVSSRVADILTGQGVLKENVVVSPIGTLAAETLRSTERAASSPLKFGYVGPIGEKKGTPLLVQAFAKAFGARTDVQLDIYGKAAQPYRDLIEAAARGSNINYHGAFEHSQLQAIYSEIDVALVPPVWEDNGPQILFEAQACGVPVIGARIGGIPDFIKDGVNGLLFEPNNLASLKERLLTVAARPSLLSNFRKKLQRPKTLTEDAHNLVNLYHQVSLMQEVLL